MYKDRSSIYLAGAVLYVLASNYLGILSQNRAELFPIFNWSMFTNVSRYEVENVELFIDKIDGKELDPPVIAKMLPSEFPNVGAGISLRKTVYSLATAIDFKDQDSIARLKRVIDRRYLAGPRQVTYSIRLIRYPPLQRIKDGKFQFGETMLVLERS